MLQVEGRKEGRKEGDDRPSTSALDADILTFLMLV